MKKLFYLISFLFAMALVGCEKEEPENSANGHEYVDLGLSVKWATMNVGATSPEGYGDYFAWGETEPKEEYNWETYKWGNGSYDNITKYSNENQPKLDIEDDAAHANWGGAWRMPTSDEIDELLSKCSWTLCIKNGINGYTVTAQNGNSIFLPVAGYSEDFESVDMGSSGGYWSSELVEDSMIDAYILRIYTDGEYSWSSDTRYYGLSVRPVLP